MAGLALRHDVVDGARGDALTAAIDACDLSPFRFQGWLGRRLTASFGWEYDFDAARMVAGPPIPPWLLDLRGDVAGRLGLDAAAFEQALVIRYDPGAGIGWHRDRPHYGRVVGLSLGAPATLWLRRRRPAGGFDRAAVPLRPRSAYLLDGEVRSGWEHSIAPLDATRWSVTFRTLSELGRRAFRA